MHQPERVLDSRSTFPMTNHPFPDMQRSFGSKMVMVRIQRVSASNLIRRPPHDRQRLLQFLQGQFQAAPEQPVGSTNPAFRQQVEAEAVSALIAELSQPVVEIEHKHPSDDELAQPEPHPIEDESSALEADDEPPTLPDETTLPTDHENQGEPDADEEEENS